MAKRRFVLRVLAVVAAACILVLLGIRFVAVPAFENSPDYAHIVVARVEPLPSGTTMTVIFDAQVVLQGANAIYRRLASGTDMTDNPMNCPANSSYQVYYRYKLTFSRGGITVATATDDARECGVFTIERLDGSTEVVFWADDHHQCFWDYLHEVLNAPEPINLDTGTLCSAENALRSASGPDWTEY